MLVRVLATLNYFLTSGKALRLYNLRCRKEGHVQRDQVLYISFVLMSVFITGPYKSPAIKFVFIDSTTPARSFMCSNKRQL